MERWGGGKEDEEVVLESEIRERNGGKQTGRRDDEGKLEKKEREIYARVRERRNESTEKRKRR